MKLLRPIAFVAGLLLTIHVYAQQLKSVVYDFDGFDTGSSSLPEGDYSYGDLSYSVVANPLAASDVLGDRVLKLNLNWNAGYGAFGRGISRYLELDPAQDRFNFYFYHPLSNAQNAVFTLKIADDDNLNYIYETASDDDWTKTFTVTPSAGWQLISVGLNELKDNNAGGNGIFDIAFSQNKGMLMLVELRFQKPAATAGNASFYIDMLCFSEGAMPQGAGPLNLPAKTAADHCLLGAHQNEKPGEYYLIPSKFEGLFPAVAGKKIRYVNTYMQWATNGSTTPHALPGAGYQTLMDNGYRPVITWEPMFSGYSPLDPAQPRLQDIIDGDYNTYIDAFADKIKTYSDTVIIRLMHEFDGDWYSWCVSQNNQDPQRFVTAFRKIVDRFRTKGANNVKWMWCPNSDYSPNRHWNWVVSAYPGDSYVDMVSTDVYNSHYPSTLPWWRSFRWQTAEIYYYLSKYFPTKPLVICELASRERQSTEPAASQTKAGWVAAMDKDLQSYFRKTRGIIFFSENKTQNWLVNTSPAALQSLTDNIWMDDYYFLPKAPGPTAIKEANETHFNLYPNPADDHVSVSIHSAAHVTITDALGKEVYAADLPAEGNLDVDVEAFPGGVYTISARESNGRVSIRKLLVR